MIVTSPARDKEDIKFILANLLTNIFGNQLVLGDIHAPMNQISDIFKISRNGDIIGGWSLFHGFEIPVIAFPFDPSGWEAITGFVSMRREPSYIVPFAVESDQDHGNRPWDVFDNFDGELMYSDIAMRITTKDIEVRDISDLPDIRATTEDDNERLMSYYQSLGQEFFGFYHPLQLKMDNYVVCEDADGEIIATAGTHFETPYTVQLGNIHVRKEYRGRGIGRAVTTAVTLGAIKTQRVPTLFVREDNTTAIRLYESIGFEGYNKFDFYKMTRI